MAIAWVIASLVLLGWCLGRLRDHGPAATRDSSPAADETFLPRVMDSLARDRATTAAWSKARRLSQRFRPLSILMLCACWMVGLTIAFACLHRALGTELHLPGDEEATWGAYLYMSGTTTLRSALATWSR